MDKQETEQLNMDHWVIVHETPFMGWLGRLDEGWFTPGAFPDLLVDLIGMKLKLADALVLQTTQMPVPGPGRTMQMGIITHVMAPHSLTTETLLVAVMPQRITLVRDLNPADKRSLGSKIQAARAALLAQRAAASGIELPGSP